MIFVNSEFMNIVLSGLFIDYLKCSSLYKTITEALAQDKCIKKRNAIQLIEYPDRRPKLCNSFK